MKSLKLPFTRGDRTVNLERRQNCETETPSTALSPSTANKFHLSRKSSQALIAANAIAIGSKVLTSGNQMRTGPKFRWLTSAKNTCRANQIDRFKITPTTAAVIALSAPFKRGCAEIQSMYGAPAKIYKKQGANVTHNVMNAAATPCPTVFSAAR